MKKYVCKVCNAELYWNSKAGCLQCEYCDNKFDISDFEFTEEDTQNQASNEPETADENETATDESESSELVIYKCNECGAEIITAKSTIATTCAYCGKAISLTKKLVGNFKPDFVIPFEIDKEKANNIYKKYSKSTFLTPKHFKDENQLQKMKGIYVPFWLHSFHNKATAKLYCEKESFSRKVGDDKVITYRQYNINVEAKSDFDKIPTDGLKNLENSLMDAIEPFDYKKMQPFNPAYMAGYYAEEYNESKEETILRAKIRATKAMKENILSSINQYSQKSISDYSDSFSDYQTNYIMLPVWIFNTEYNGQKYTFAINGESGKITGKLPISFIKLFSIIGTSIVGTQLIALLIRLLT